MEKLLLSEDEMGKKAKRNRKDRAQKGTVAIGQNGVNRENNKKSST